MFPEEGAFKKAHLMFLKFLLSIYFLIYAYVVVNRERRQKSEILENPTRDKHWPGCGGKGMLVPSWQECKLVQPMVQWETVWRFLKILKIALPHDPAIPLLDISPYKMKLLSQTNTLMFTAALLIVAKTWKQPKCPSVEEWIKKG